jgi:REP element-mobilizing transposase RayT
MARYLRVRFPGAIYHVTVRGNRRGLIFDDDVDSRKFLEKIGASVDHFHVRLYLFCLLKNHFHLLAEPRITNLRDFMANLLSGSSVSHQIRNLEYRLKGRRALLRRLKKVESILENELIKNAPLSEMF